jgi:protein phosphatase
MLLEGQDRKPLGQGNSHAEDSLIPAAITDTGCERELNEDRYAVIECASGVAWLVCDGMGGTTGGELAAQLAIDAIRRDLEKHAARSPDVALKNAVIEANRVIVLRRQNQAFSSMGTTVVAAIFEGPEVVIANVGDSRAYLVRDTAIQQLTLDHTYVQQLVDRGEIKPEDALAHPQAHILTRCVGAEPGIEVDLRKFWIWPVNDGDVRDSLLLCSDGLYSLVAETEIATIVARNSPQAACVRLVELAKARGGYDNITISIIPLAGQMRQNPPPETEDHRAKAKPVAQQAAPRSTSRWSLGSHAVLIIALSAVAMFAAALIFIMINFL